MFPSSLLKARSHGTLHALYKPFNCRSSAFVPSSSTHERVKFRPRWKVRLASTITGLEQRQSFPPQLELSSKLATSKI